tara:strand:+ start:316 stop:780 length:465 start_codon:yes stop_codon:yes gene_type:complete
MLTLNNIELIVYDFDGVMTDNHLFLDENGKELVRVSRADGLGVSEIKKLNIKQIILSTETNTVVSMRAKKLGIPCIQGVYNKKEKLYEYINVRKINLFNVIFVGNDLNDLEVMRTVGYKICPADAHQDIIDIADLVLKTKGGQGITRELLELLK